MIILYLLFMISCVFVFYIKKKKNTSLLQLTLADYLQNAVEPADNVQTYYNLSDTLNVLTA